MNLDIQFKIRNDSNCTRYIRENSHWYKILNRYPEQFNDFMNEMKERYRLRPTDKITDFVDKLEVINNLFSALK
ncbi:MAG: YlbE-like family protein [Bacilli bacterium]|nr:YlbE-like family protein [Bacilli bacterium]MDD4298373.1 YlbE-like family protein [Bacilli bacterium]MDD4643917.1 YlbE-like family protein [Bacilli bacterium]